MKKNYLICKRVKFYSFKDEDAFFWWIKRIKCIEKFEGIGDKLYLHLEDKPLTDGDLDDIIGLFHRYDINMKQLARFLTPANKDWFYDNKKVYWHENVFGSK